ncbi:MAG: ABC transporter substrate-binding protein, partial [Spirochaetaceae bacterium]|nr:ABC transporter substrate-binding protein [Spirochaetaceae bacterium]
MKRFILTGLLAFLAVALPIGASENRFTVQFSPSRINWNPHYAYTTNEAQIFTALYEGLLTYHPATLRPIPGSAESWEFSEDNTTITFTIRKDALWSNGERITSEDFLESWL